MKIEADWLQNSASQRLLSSFQNAGYVAYFVGGCVRNALLDAPVADLDVSTNALPQQTISVAKTAGFHTIPTGFDHGTITVVVDDVVFEVTSFRKDVETHGRRAVVAFSNDIKDDALRRDFTMNALYAAADGRVIDPLNGLADVRQRRVRFIKNPELRVKEDYLRILRYFRFFAWYGQQSEGLDEEALSAISGNLEGLRVVSKERIGAEMRKLLSAPDPVQAVAGMEQTGVLSTVLCGASARFLGPLVHLENEAGVDPDWLRRLISLGGQNTQEALRLSKAEARRIERFQSANDLGAGPKEIAFRFGEQTAWDVEFIRASALGVPLPEDVSSNISAGVSAQFPVCATDLQPQFHGRALGDELKRLETKWINSGFILSKSDLIPR